jgi:magnesium chelatase subunit D
LLAALTVGGPTNRQASAGRAGLPRKSADRGRPVGVRRGTPGHGARLALVETLRAAAPWQTIRRAGREAQSHRIQIRREDFRIARFQQKSETTTIFVVDASGSAALNRLAEVKGAVELILADCYIRRDSVALIAFRGTQADLILPPTRSLARAKRALAGQPGGGGTPLALAIDAASILAGTIRRKGPVPMAVFLTDGRANITRDGKPGRAEAEKDALQSARAARAVGLTSLLIDISPRPTPAARDIAAAMGARYLPLPYADARVLSQAVRAAPGLGAGRPL